MKPKIIIADDQQTTQKVVKVYISKLEEDPNLNLECELIECTHEKDLIPLVKEHSPQLVLLDFNLSENKTGYDLATEIKNEIDTKILVLYGTFDKVDESLFDQAGISDYAVKPMDVVKFLGQLQSLLEEYSSDNTKVFSVDDLSEDAISDSEADELEFQGEEIEDEFVSDEIYVVDDEPQGVEIDESWVVEQPSIDHNEEVDTEVSTEELNTLEAGMQDWGMDVPPVIGEPENTQRFPPVIDEVDSDQTLIMDTDADKFPSEEDLEYPEVEQSSSIELTPISDLSEVEEKNNEISLDHTLGTSTPEEVKALEDQISDEVEITSTYQIDDIWNSDEVVDEEEQRIRADFDSEPTLTDLNISELKSPSIEVSEDDIAKKLEEILPEMVEKIVREKVDTILEKVSWEVVPDLAENLIKKELKEITNQVLDSN